MSLDFSYENLQVHKCEMFLKLQVLEFQRLFFMFYELISINYREIHIFCI
jgi:hypothetical protein